jgi:hypothetical protein
MRKRSFSRLVVVGRQIGLIFVYNTKSGRLISKSDKWSKYGPDLPERHHVRTGWQCVRDGLHQPCALSRCAHERGTI